MEKIDYSGMSNADLKLCVEKYYNEFESVKSQIIELCKKLEEVQTEYQKADSELNNRKNILL